ncbi:carcinoembryonic antigen-related cell adhesion molecule 1-like isoform X2 [Choloepus didactylus]|uniref:carcinoembryonic antigen-related cell adhesion molecule 1-like isoform X2 n=1 Tax=Choloepus didactylus TaxID=27675 RepID=UPI0018A07804|nr:carcinoembryonic antigen-related cell adhesion molecule 1-like isoform X2 [Choloepus didactylus]
MEPPSGPPRRGQDPRLGPLLTVSVLIIWSRPITAQLRIESVPFNAAEGNDVLLLAHNQSENTYGYSWFKGEKVDEDHQILAYVIDSQQTTPGSAHSGRERIYPNGSLLLQNVTQGDSGAYTLQVSKRNLQIELSTGWFHVYPELPVPFITSNNSDPMEDQDSVAFTCEPETQNTTYRWLINNQSLPVSARLELSLDNRTLTIHNVTRNDLGFYECGTQNPVSARRSDPVMLNVLYGPDAPTISPPGSYYTPGANLSLSCLAASNPPAEYSWLINGRPQQSTQELFIPNVSVNDSGSYTCHVHNNVTGLNRTTVRTITVSESVTKPTILASNTTVTEHKDSVVLTCLSHHSGVSTRWIFNGQSLRLTERMELSQGNSTLRIDPVKKADEGNYQCEVSNGFHSSESDPLRLIVQNDSAQGSSGLSAGAIAGIVVGVLAGVALIAALGYFLYSRKTGGTNDQRDLTEHKPSASNHSQDHSDKSPNTIAEVAYSSVNFNVQQLKKLTSASPSPTDTGTVYSEVKMK